MKFDIVHTRNRPTVKVTVDRDSYYLHSKYDPLKEADLWASGIIKSNNAGNFNIVVIGMGAGHHIRALLSKDNIHQITVLEFNDDYYRWIIDSGFVNDLLSNSKITYQSIKNGQDLENSADILDEHFVVYQPALRVFSRGFEKVKDLLENYIIQERTFLSQKEKLLLNFNDNLRLNDDGITRFRKLVKTKSILVSAGPSLTKQLPLLKEAYLSKSFTIGVVGTAYIPLLNFGIIPDFVMISDPSDLLVGQFSGFDTDKTILFYLSTASSKAVANFKGKRFIIWQEGYNLAEVEAGKRNEPLIQTGGSVATCLLDLMVNLGATQIALVGQDLAITEGKSHAENTQRVRKITNTQKTLLIKIPNYDKNSFVYTTRNLSVYLNWFERYVFEKKGIEFWNCTEGGAYIKNWKHCPFEAYLRQTQ